MNDWRRNEDGEKNAKVLEKARKAKIFNTFGENCILVPQTSQGLPIQSLNFQFAQI